mmetsp:Transcript_38827/g.93223  ORF Transcript_38827/g.93223 Transcript_38827/m.93223 type:complete len:203 (-) Transcript_38827:207-815(-)
MNCTPVAASTPPGTPPPSHPTAPSAPGPPGPPRTASETPRGCRSPPRTLGRRCTRTGSPPGSRGAARGRSRSCRCLARCRRHRCGPWRRHGEPATKKRKRYGWPTTASRPCGTPPSSRRPAAPSCSRCADQAQPPTPAACTPGPRRRLDAPQQAGHQQWQCHACPWTSSSGATPGNTAQNSHPTARRRCTARSATSAGATPS